MGRDIKFIKVAIEVAKLSTHRFPTGAVITRGSKIISFGINKYKTHPLQRNHHTDELGTSIHAELDAILKVPRDKGIGASIYIVRLLKNNFTGNAKPCKYCRKLLIAENIYIIVYSIGNNKFIKEDLRKVEW